MLMPDIEAVGSMRRAGLPLAMPRRPAMRSNMARPFWAAVLEYR
jgi:hypothetical protein